MERPPLSNSGVTEKLDQLYALPDADLQKEINLINSDTKGWIVESFATTEDQESFINGLSSTYTSILAGQLTRTLESRWPVIFIQEATEPAARSSKWIKSKEENEASERGSNRSVNNVGSLTITTGY